MTRTATRAAALVAVLVLGLLVAVAAGGGLPRVVVTHGTSMQPTLVAGDLVLIAPSASSCTPGTIAAYRGSREVVLHRVLRVQDGRCVFQGDNNAWTDQESPLPSQVLGALVLRIPGGGVWWHRLTSPVLVGVIAFALIGLGGTPSAPARSRRRRRRAGRFAPAPLAPVAPLRRERSPV